VMRYTANGHKVRAVARMQPFDPSTMLRTGSAQDRLRGIRDEPLGWFPDFIRATGLGKKLKLWPCTV